MTNATDDRTPETSVSIDADCSTALYHERLRKARRRAILSLSSDAMDNAIADFPMRVADMASHMKRLLNLRRWRVRDNNTDAAIAVLRERIQREYRDIFGTELGQ